MRHANLSATLCVCGFLLASCSAKTGPQPTQAPQESKQSEAPQEKQSDAIQEAFGFEDSKEQTSRQILTLLKNFKPFYLPHKKLNSSKGRAVSSTSKPAVSPLPVVELEKTPQAKRKKVRSPCYDPKQEKNKHKKKRGLSKIVKLMEKGQVVFKGFAGFQGQQDKAKVKLNFHDVKYEKDFSIYAKLVFHENQWKLSSLEKVDNTDQKYSQWEKEKLKQLNERIVQKIKESINLVKVDKWNNVDRWGQNRRTVVDIELQNSSKRKIKSFRGELILRDKRGRRLMTYGLQDKYVDPGQLIEAQASSDVNLFIQKDLKLFKASNNELLPELAICEIQFADGSSLKVLQDLPNRVPASE